MRRREIESNKGLSGSGKSTLANALADRLSRAEKNRASLDRGDLTLGAAVIRSLLKFLPPGAAIAIDGE